MTKTEVLIVGGGVTGLTAGLELRRLGRSVLVVERREVGAGASGNNAGSCALQNKLLPLMPLAVAAVDIWREWQEELAGEGLDVMYRRTGGLRLAESEAEVKVLQNAIVAQRPLGVNTTLLTREETLARAPYLGPNVRAATWCPDDGYCDVLHAMRALETALRRRDGMIWTHTEVTGVERQPHGFVVRTDRGPVQAERLVVAAGAWARDLGGMLGTVIPLNVKINIMSVTGRLPPIMPHMISHASHRLTMKQLPVGTVMIGGGWKGLGDYRSYSVWPTFESLVGNLRLAVAAVPALAGLNILRMWASVDGRSPDDMPLIGSIPGLPGAYIGACCPGGWTIGPFIGRAMAQMVQTDRVPEMLQAFDPARYTEALAQ